MRKASQKHHMQKSCVTTTAVMPAPNNNDIKAFWFMTSWVHAESDMQNQTCRDQTDNM